MSVLGSAMMMSGGSVPFLRNLQLWLDGADLSSMTTAYQNLTSTVTGTSGGTTLVCTGNESATVFTGMTIRAAGTDIYTVQSVATSVGVTTITIVGTLSTNYSASVCATLRASQWNDKSGLGNNVTQGTATAQPTYFPAALNNKSVLSFDGNDTLIVPAALYTISAGANSIFIVAKVNAVSGTQRFVSGSITANSRYGVGTFTTNYTYINSTAGTGLDLSGITATNYNIISGTRSGTGRTLSFNNGVPVTSSNATDVTCTEMFIGSRDALFDFIIGSIAEIIIYNRALTAAEIIQVNRYLSQKWNITIS